MTATLDLRADEDLASRAIEATEGMGRSRSGIVRTTASPRWPTGGVSVGSAVPPGETYARLERPASRQR